VETAMRLAQQQGVVHQRLRTSHAFHSPMMQSAAKNFLEFMSDLRYEKANIPIVSNVTGQLLGEYEVRNPLYWTEHLLRTVRFSDGVACLTQLGVRHFVEIGHGFSMSNLVRANLSPQVAAESLIVQAMGSVDEEYTCYLDTVAMAYTLTPGLALEPHIRVGRKISLPTYPFARNAHWVNPVLGFQLPSHTTSTEMPVQVAAAMASKSSALGVQAPQSVDSVPKTEVEDSDEDNPVEGIVQGIYRDFLGGEHIDRELTFFDLGGNSLVAIQLINRLRETFQVDIPLRGFYQGSSIASVSNLIAQRLLELENHV
jgi:acyl transferase domain-containing protein